MNKLEKDYQNTIDRVDNMIRENNRKYLDQKSQIQYEKALQQYQRHKQRQIAKQYAQQIKQGNKKAIQKKQKQLSVNKAKSRISVKSNLKAETHSKQPQKAQLKPRQKLSQKQLKKVQKAVQARAERHLQQMQLQKLNKKLQEQKRKTKLFQLTQTCQKLLSKSHKRIPAVSDKIPLQRRVLLEQFSKKAQEQVEELDNIIQGLIHKSRNLKQKGNAKKMGDRSYDESEIKDERVGQRKGGQVDDIFSEEFEIEFMKEIIKGKGQQGDWKGINGYESPEDLLFTKPASELFQMDYIPIN